MLKNLVLYSLLGLSQSINIQEFPRSSEEYKKFKKQQKAAIDSSDFKFDEWRE